MQKQLAIVAALIILAIAGVVGYMQFAKKPPQTSQGNQTSEQQNQSVVSATKGSIKSLLSGGKNVSCKVTYPDNQGTGTVFIANDKMRGDFTTVTDGKTYESHVISDGQYSYFWSNDNKGMKMKIDKSVEEAKQEAQQNQSQNVDLDKEVDMDCSSWGVDSSQFTPPANVEFTDYSSMMPQTTQPGTGSQQPNMKADCEGITDPAAKAACLQYSGQ